MSRRRATPAKPVTPRRSWRRSGRMLGLVSGAVVVLALLVLVVLPTPTYLAQRRNIRETEQRLTVLRHQNQAYEDRVERLQSAEEIERLAREQYNLVLPGEEAYAVLAAPLPPLEFPSLWPFGPMLSAPAPAEPPPS
ncbi:MAG: septum formation initiator family protein [Acidimicrobiia bacterium]|nr:septum formation initiator family protein [Acidimicrobiia bacterium]